MKAAPAIATLLLAPGDGLDQNPRSAFRRGPSATASASEFDVRPLAPTVALVTARYILFRGGQTTDSGPFTLVMERRTNGWKILHDHSSAD